MAAAATLRFVEERDAAALARIYAPFCESTAISFEYVAPTVQQMLERVRKWSSAFPWLVAECDGEIVGYAYASPHRERAAYGWSVDVSVYLDPRFQRRGIGTALYTALLRMLVVQGYYKAFAGITLPNAGSVGIHRSLGFEPVGVYRGVGYKFGRWHDVIWLQYALQPEVESPAPPRPLDEIRDSEPIQVALTQ